MTQPNHAIQEPLSFEDFRKEVLQDYRVACLSREISLIARKEVLTGKAKFGIFGDGKEIAQVALSKFFRPGDWRSGYYRDQTLALASGLVTIEQYFSQLYADPDSEHEPHSSGRQMNAHFATPILDNEGHWLPLVESRNCAADMAPTASQMPRALGLAFASKLFRQVDSLSDMEHLSRKGSEVCIATIGDASTSEGHFWETVNAASVLQVPLAIFVYDDGYGISVPKRYQTAKGSISAALEGFVKTERSNGIDLYRVKGWDYAALCETFERGLQRVRDKHIPAVFHIEELTQPLGHSTSGSHERYKSKERLAWERDWDCNHQMRLWMLENALASEEELRQLERETHEEAQAARTKAYRRFQAPIKALAAELLQHCQALLKDPQAGGKFIRQQARALASNKEPLRRDILSVTSRILQRERHLSASSLEPLRSFYERLRQQGRDIYNTYLYAEGPGSVHRVPEVPAQYREDSPMINGYEILNRYFDQLISRDSRVFAFGEDVGLIGDVNQAFAGLQQKHGEQRVFDTGIRELTIVGQAIGMALRGLRPIAEIQYMDYLIYGLEQLTDDVASLHYRTRGRQSCPLVIRTRGHRLEGIWHSGSPTGMLLNSLRGMYLCVPRNMVQASGMYNTLMQANEPALIVECLNGYRLKERLPDNLDRMTVPLGVPEVLHPGEDLTLVSYGSVLRIAQEAIQELEVLGVSVELIDVQTLLPFDIYHRILDSLKKTNRILFLDEDVPGGSTAYMLQQVLEVQGGYRWLDVAARCLSGKAHRPAYGSDGDYFSKPNAEDIVDTVMEMMRE